MNNEDKAYIAGFLDGDGSILAQLVRRKDYRLGYQIRTSVVFFQKTHHLEHLCSLKQQLGYGYIRSRHDGMSEYTIVGFREVAYVLSLLYPYLRLKQELAKRVLEIIELHPQQRALDASHFLRLCELVDNTAKLTYSKKRSVRSNDVRTFLSSSEVPVETGFQVALDEDTANQPYQAV